MQITIPYKYTPREYQLPIMRAMDSGCRHAVQVWHRRAGKDKTDLNIMIKKSVERPGVYYYTFPTYAQAKKAIWEGVGKDGTKYLDHFPTECIKHKDESELKITTTWGSIIRFVGTENINSLMGTNPFGIVYSEYSLQDPSARQMMRPILLENGGWEIINFTPRGKNHGWQIAELAKSMVQGKNREWFYQLLTIEDTDVLSEADIDQERREGMDEELIQQEYYCSFTGVQVGSYYGKVLERIEKDGHICKVPYIPSIPVDTWWDLGVSDAMAIWFTQNVGRAVHVIDYLENSGEGLPFYAKELDQKDYLYGTHNAPHDIAVRELGSGKSRIETARELGINFRIVPNISRQDGIDAVRSFLPKCYFDRDKTEKGRLALASYQKKWNEKAKCFENSPLHDWSSNGADGFRYLAVGHKHANPRKQTVSDRGVPINSGATAAGAGWMGA